MTIDFGEINILKHSRKIEKDKVNKSNIKEISMIIYEQLYFELYSKMVKLLAESKPIYFDMIKTDIEELENEYKYTVFIEYRYKIDNIKKS